MTTRTYGWFGWDAETDSGNNDDRQGVHHITITEDGEEYATITHRTVEGKYPLDGEVAQEKLARAKRITAALNAFDGDAGIHGVAQTITFGADLVTTFARALTGLVHDDGLVVAVSLYSDDWETTTPLQDVVVKRVVSSEDLLRTVGVAPDEEWDDYLIALPYDPATCEAVKGGFPQIIPSSRIARLHIH